MVALTVVAFVLVLGTKYYTSQGMRKLELRLKAVKEGFKKIKDAFTLALKQQDIASAEESINVERIRAMKEIIQDINVRLSTSDSLGPDRMQETKDAMARRQ